MGCKWIRVRLIIYSANEINCVLNVFSLRLETYPKGFIGIVFYFCSDLINQYQWRLHVLNVIRISCYVNPAFLVI
jgi:hypothetical protein